MSQPSTVVCRDRLYISILIHVIPLCLVLLVHVCDVVISVHLCTQCRLHMLRLRYPSHLYSYSSMYICVSVAFVLFFSCYLAFYHGDQLILESFYEPLLEEKHDDWFV